jgi:ubiquinone/menaquinone biosynthesis C-methylase UbiE
MKQPAQPNFDRVAHIYRWGEYLALGPLLQRVRTHFLAELDDRHNALVIGDGDGRFLATLLRRNSRLQAHAVDTSSAMLNLLSQRCGFARQRLHRVNGSLLNLTPRPETDLVVTHFVLDCFTQPQVDRAAERIASGLRPGALWLVSDFGIPNSPLLRPFAAAYIRALYFVFRLLTGLRVTQLPDPQAALRRAGFTLRQRHAWCNGFLYTELWQRGYNQQGERIQRIMSDAELAPLPNDAQPNPEPAVPSLPGPDPGVYRHDVTPTEKTEPNA